MSEMEDVEIRRSGLDHSHIKVGKIVFDICGKRPVTEISAVMGKIGTGDNDGFRSDIFVDYRGHGGEILFSQVAEQDGYNFVTMLF